MYQILTTRNLILMSAYYDDNIPPPVAEIRQVPAVHPAVVALPCQRFCLLVSGVLGAPHKHVRLHLRHSQNRRAFDNDVLAMDEYLYHRRAFSHARRPVGLVSDLSLNCRRAHRDSAPWGLGHSRQLLLSSHKLVLFPVVLRHVPVF